MDDNKIQLFEDKRIRTAWDEETEEWLFSVVDVIGVLTDQPTQRSASNYWRKLKQLMKDEGNQLVTNCHQLKMKSADGKRYNTDVANTEQLFRTIVPQGKLAAHGVYKAHFHAQKLNAGRNQIHALVMPQDCAVMLKILVMERFFHNIGKGHGQGIAVRPAKRGRQVGLT